MLTPRNAERLAIWFGCGLSPKAPGTVGSLGALPLHALLRLTNPGVHFLFVVALSAVGVWASQQVADETGESDPQKVVIDEVAGTLIALGMVRHMGIAKHIAAFVLFRLLDILKPGPIGRAEHAKPAGVGIMADDLLAGIVAGAVVRGLG